MLKQYYSCSDDQIQETSIEAPSTKRLHANTVSVIDNVDEETQDDGFPNCIPLPSVKETGIWKYIHIGNDLNYQEKTQILQMLETYSDIFIDIPGRTKATQYVITLFVDRAITIS